MASGRIVRWSLTLASYDYKLCYKPGCKIPNADCLSRFPMKVGDFDPPNVGEEVLMFEQIDNTTIKSEDIRRWTDRDPVMSQVRTYILQGWSDSAYTNEEFKPYLSRKEELSVLQGCTLWGYRIVVPPHGRDSLTEELHITHLGIVKMKNLARC